MNFTVSNEALSALGEAISAIPGVSATEIAHGELNVLAEAGSIVAVLTALRDQPALKFQQLIDLCGVDYPERAKRFDVVYHLLSLTHNHRVRVKVQTDEMSAVSTITSVYPCADHPDLRRLLTDYGFQGHPLRKDFPMTGYVEVRYDDELKRVVYEPVKITEFRAFDFLSPWEGAQYALPGDEKAEAK